MASVRKRTWKAASTVDDRGNEVPGLEKTAWIVDYFDQDRVRHIKTFDRKKDADAYLTTVSHEVMEGTHTAPSTSITVGQAAEAWIDACNRNRLERSTVVQYQNHIDHHIKPMFGRSKLSSLTTPMVEKFATELLGRPFADDPSRTLSRSMAKKVLASLKGIVKEAQRKGKIAKNPASPVTIKVAKRGTRKVRPGRDFPSKAEINTILKNVAGRWRPLIITAVFTGMRSSELRGLAWKDVDFDAKAIHVHRRADRWGVMGATKSEAGERDLPMTPMVTNALKEWRKTCPTGDLGLVFPNGDGKPENHANIANRCYYELQRTNEITEPVMGPDGKQAHDEEGEPLVRPKYGFHTLRHFYASWLIEQDFSPKKVQTLLGHSTIAMTYDTYGHMFPTSEDDHAKLAAGELALVG